MKLDPDFAADADAAPDASCPQPGAAGRRSTTASASASCSVRSCAKLNGEP